MFSPSKVGARIFVEVIVQKWLNCESFPILTLGPVPELIQCHQLVLILRPIIVAVPVNKDTNRGEPNIGSDCHIPEETLLINDALFTFKFNKERFYKKYVSLGGLYMTSGSEGLKLRAVAGRPSVTRFTQRS